MYGKETFDSYVPRFLNHDTEKDLWHKVLVPVNWPRLAKPLVSRSDLEVEYFDQGLFDKASGVRRHDAFATRDHHRHRPGARQTVRVHARTAQRHLRGPEERAAGPRGIRLGGNADLLRAAGHAFISPDNAAMFLPTASAPMQQARKTSIAVSGPSGCCRSSTAKKYPYLHLADGALADNLGRARHPR